MAMPEFPGRNADQVLDAVYDADNGVIKTSAQIDVTVNDVEVTNFPASQVVEGDLTSIGSITNPVTIADGAEVVTELTALQDQTTHYLPVKPTAETDPVMVKKSCTATDTPEVIHANTACRKVTLQANPTNTLSIFVAFSEAECNADALELPPGYSWTEYVSNLNKIWYQGLISEKLLVIYTP